MNTKRFIAAAVCLFLFIFIYESIVHGMMLTNLYHETPNLWRSEDEMMAFMPFNIFIMALLTLWITYIFTRFYRDGGWKNGLQFGIYLGVLSGIQAAGAYFYLPISLTLAVSWLIVYIIESAIGGLIIGAVYRR